MYFITPDPGKLTSALQAWTWIGLEGKRPIRVTTFGNVFFEDGAGIWFLDTVEGKLKQVCSNEKELYVLLMTEEGKDKYLFSGFVDRAVREGQTLAPNECYDFKVSPILGGALNYANVQKQDFVVTLDISGQIHEQVRQLPPGTRISGVTVNGIARKAKKAMVESMVTNEEPNKTAAVDGGIGARFHVKRPWPAATELIR